MKGVRLVRKVILLLLILVSCSVKPNNIETNNKPNEPTEKHTLNSQYETWNEAIAGVYFLGYGDYNSFDDITSSPEFHLLLNLYPDINAFNKVQTNQGEIILLILARYDDTTIAIKTLDGELLEEEQDFDAILLRTNESELHPETQITLTHQEQEVMFEPFISMMDGRLELPEEILDLTPNNYPRDILLGAWSDDATELTFFDDGTMVFHIYENNIIYQGEYYFESPHDYREAFDDADGLIYFYLTTDNDVDRFQVFSKYFYSIDNNTLYLRHLSFDSVKRDTQNHLYTLLKEGE